MEQQQPRRVLLLPLLLLSRLLDVSTCAVLMLVLPMSLWATVEVAAAAEVGREEAREGWLVEPGIDWIWWCCDLEYFVPLLHLYLEYRLFVYEATVYMRKNIMM